MASKMHLVFLAFLSLISPFMVAQADPGYSYGYGFGWGSGSGNDYSSLSPYFYDFSCPQANNIIASVLENAVAQDPRMAASLLRLHFHDCFVQGCDASILLDDSAAFVSEKKAKPNLNSLRGFTVIDEIKARLEEACPETVSCADILALVARAASVLSGGPNWEVPLGRRDSKAANMLLANATIPPPILTAQKLIASFQQQGLDEVDLVALSGAHTIGVARCTSFKQRLYSQSGNSQPDLSLEKAYLNELKSVCPSSGGDNNITPLDYASPKAFDNTYYKLILGGRGLLFTDQQLYSGNYANLAQLVKSYAEDEGLFFDQFAKSMVKMGKISPLLGTNGEVRKYCRRPN
ncbi:peroxidase 9-like [Chenopodium quinoa]|uniref:Peroxidase n=1 Tax=Chenopodium quinoa TaxID=63459 RepID=A0A803MSH4_CHEQI|nr:peroxidase 9-like [Chenopodium quinoa]